MTGRRVLRTDVWVDGVRYHVGTIPPASVAEQITNAKAWTQVAEPVQAPEPVPAAVSSGAVFDPSDHTVVEVHDYLASADDDEKARVLDAERAGKGRAGLIGS